MRTILLALLLGLTPMLVSAQAFDRQAPAAPQNYAPLPQSPDQLLRQGVDRLTGFLIGAGNPSPMALRTFLGHEVAPYFDFAYMARFAAGPLYRRMTADQHQRLNAKIENIFLDALARNLGTYARPLPRIDIYPARAGRAGNDASVIARVVTDAGLVVNLEFRWYWNDGGWKIFDVSANGASALLFYRGYFSTLIRRYGPEAALR